MKPNNNLPIDKETIKNHLTDNITAVLSKFEDETRYKLILLAQKYLNDRFLEI